MDLVVKNGWKLFETLAGLKDFVGSIPEHKDGISITSKDVKNEMDFINKFNFMRKEIIIAKIGEESFRVFGNDTYEIIMNHSIEKQLEQVNFVVHIVELRNKKGIKELVKNIKIQYSYN